MPIGAESLERVIANYIDTHGTVAVLAWDRNNTVLYCNKAFADTMHADFVAVGKSVFEFLRFPDYPECKFGNLAGAIKSTASLNTIQGVYRCDSIVLPFDNGYVVFCDRPVLLQSDIVEKMAKMNLELTNLSWEGRKKNRKIEKMNEQLQREIAERKLAEEELISAKQRYQGIMNQSSEALALIDIESQEVIEVNRRFTELFGYSLPEDAPLHASKYVVDWQDNTAARLKITLTQSRCLPAEVQSVRHKNGSLVYVERSGSVISLGSRNYLLTSSRDMTRERKRQAELTRDAAVAKRVQQALLPAITESPFLDIRIFYYPSNFVSGDSYYLTWENEGTLLRGFLIDVAGHGLATALQTAAISVLLRETAPMRLSLLEQIYWINQKVAKYFTESSYAAILGFELDLSARNLRYVSAGITQFYFNGRKILSPGMFVGIWNDAEFDEHLLPLSEGDTFCFLTDGFTDILAQQESAGIHSMHGKDFDAHVATLEQLAENEAMRDDATGICLKIKALSRCKATATIDAIDCCND